MDELELYDRDKGLFKEVLKLSKVMQGRYHVSSDRANDLNTDNLNSFLSDPMYGISNPEQKYPLVVCMAPYSVLNGHYETFYFDLFFLCTTGYTGQNQVKSVNKPTHKSEHHIWYDWKDMKVAAEEFLQMLSIVLQNNIIQAAINKEGIGIRRLSKMNNDRVSGVGINFTIDVALNPCEPKDYDLTEIEAISFIPSIIHPHHKH